MAEAAAWGRGLSVSSQNVMRWAHAYALLRSQGATPNASATADGEIDALDVLAGLFLEHGDDSEVWDFFEHFGIPIGSVLPRGRVELDALLEARAVSEKEYEEPPIGPEVRAIVEHGVRSLAPADREGLLSFTLLFAALLETSNVASTAIRAALDSHGAPSFDVIASYREYATGASVKTA